MELPVIHVFTHDSIGVGEDGPTHQPVEHLASLRAVPGLMVMRPADANEVRAAWKVIMELHHEPAALVVTRQALPTLDRSRYASADGVARGAYVLADAPDGKPDRPAPSPPAARSRCAWRPTRRWPRRGVKSRVVSMPCWELFDDQDEDYRNSVIPPEVTARVSVEQASVFGWTKYTGIDGHQIGMRSFGASAPLKDLQKKFGLYSGRRGRRGQGADRPRAVVAGLGPLEDWRKHEPVESVERAGAVGVAGLHPAQASHRRRVEAAGGGGRAQGRHVQSGHLREGYRRQRRLRRRDRAHGGGRRGGTQSGLRGRRHPGHPGGGGRVAAGVRRDRAARRLRQPGGVAVPRP